MGSREVAEAFGYAPEPIDVDKGVSFRENRETGIRVYMYKRMPGVYLNQSGAFVSDEVAKAAGFDVQSDRRKADAERRIAEATRHLRLEAAEIEARILAGEDIADLPKLPFTSAVKAADLVTDRNKDGQPRGTRSFLMVHVGGSNWNVVDRDSTAIVFEKVTGDVAVSKMIEAQKALDEQESQAA